MERIIKKISVQSWMLAIRPKTLSAGIVPVAVGTLLSNVPLVAIDWFIALCTLLCSMSIQIAANLLNDVLDFKKGTDTKDRLGPVRVTQAGLLTPDQVLRGGFFCCLLALLFGIPLILKGGLLFLALIVVSICFSYFYTGGPFPLAYLGAGEPFVILFYGFLATMASHFLQTGEWGGLKLAVISLQLGLLITSLLAINNLRDHEGDSKANKKTLAARFGVDFAKREIACLVTIPFLLNFSWIFTGDSLLFFLPMTSLPMGINLVKRIYQFAPGKIYNRFFGDASLLIFLFGTLLILGHRLLK